VESFRTWRKSIAEAILRLPRSAATYEDASGNRAHYERISDLLLARFGDAELARAAFLHGVHPTELRDLRAVHSGLSKAVMGILDDRQKLRSIGMENDLRSRFSEDDGERVARHLAGNVLPLIRDARAVVLFVAEQINHLDVDGSFERWTINFKAEPKQVVGGLPPSEVKDRFPDVRARAQFLRFVVAPTAESFGMWVERDTARNLALIHEKPEQFRALVDEVERDRQSKEGFGRTRESFVRERLGTGKQPLSVQWEWHHVATLDDELRQDAGSRDDHDGVATARTSWERRFDHLGHVTVVCKTPGDCYQTLARLHRGPFVERSIRDFLGAPRISGYRAIHTVLIRVGKRPDFPDLVHVHVVPYEAWSRRLEHTSKAHLRRMQARVSRSEHKLLRVFAHDGRAIDLPLGATVLNYAHHLHSDFVLRLRAATVNRRPVGVLHTLREGDVVWLDLSDTEQPVADGWESQVPKSTIRRLRATFSRAYRPTLEKNGRRMLRRRLTRLGWDDISDSELDSLVLKATDGMFEKPYELNWVYRQLGLVEALELGTPIPTASAIDATRADLLAADIVNRHRPTPEDNPRLEIPDEFAGRFDDHHTCEQCMPTMAEQRGVTLTSRTLTVHRLNARCATDAVPLRQVRPPDDQHFFIIETTNRIGIGAEILSVFQEHDVDLAELVGRRLATGWGVFRVGADHISATRQAALTASLQLPGVIRVIGPGEPSIPFFDELLPSPSASLNYWIKPAPYEAGPPIEDDRLFYGMRTELAELAHAFDGVCMADGGSGQFVFVSGPLRVGKTSVVKQFLRRLSRDPGRPHIAVYHLPKRTKWTDVAAQIKEKLLARIPNPPAALRETPTLEELMSAIRAEMDIPLVIVVDEIPGLLKENSAWDEQIVAFERFQEHVRGMSRVLVIWIGPSLALQKIDPRIQHLFSKSKEVDVGSLNEDDVEAMLRADKMGSEYAIHLKGSRLAKVIAALTNGNPFWVSHLALAMFRSERPRHGSRVITYSRKALADAKETLFLRGKPFLDRVESPLDRLNTEALSVKRDILNLISDSDRSVSSKDLARAFDGRCTAEKVWAYADELRLAGSLSLDGRRWRIAAPLLSEYLRFLNDTRVRASRDRS
jgi:Cdc6-like AAA superfamily ATPase